ncbi:hypothetical protein Hanom_Chr07g00623611 [Helianthus anomalus]
MVFLVFLGCHILPPLFWNFVPKFRSSFSLISGFVVLEQLGILVLHMVFSFPGKLWAMTGVPTNSNKKNSSTLENLHISVSNLYWFLNESQLIVDSELLQRNYEGLI